MSEDQPDLGRKPRRKYSNRMDRKTLRKLEDWILSNWADIKSETMTIAELAKRAKNQLGFPVSHGNVTGTIRALDLEWPHHNERSGRSYERESGARAVVIARCLIDLLEELGSVVPIELLRVSDPDYTRKQQRETDKEKEAEADA